MVWKYLFAAPVSVLPRTASTCHTSVLVWAPHLGYVASGLPYAIGHCEGIDREWGK